MLRKILILLVILSVLGGVFFYKSTSHNLAISKPLNIAVLVTKPQAINLADNFKTLANIHSSASVALSCEKNSHINKIFFHSGQFVRRGTPLIKLDDEIVKNELELAKAQLKLSEIKFRRTNKLSKKNLITMQQKDIESYDVIEKKNLVKVKELQLKQLTIKAPFTGKLGTRNINLGQYVKAGEPLVQLVSYYPMYVRYDIPEAYLKNVHLSQEVLVTSLIDFKTYKAYVTFIDPKINLHSHTLLLEAKIRGKPRDLRPGMMVEVNHNLNNDKVRLFVPEECVITTINNQYVFAVNNSLAHKIIVNTGIHKDGLIEIIKGLNTKVQVVSRGQNKLKNNQVVTIHE